MAKNIRMSKAMSTKLSKFASHKLVKAYAQLYPPLAALVTYISEGYREEIQRSREEFLNNWLSRIDKEKIDKDFLESDAGKRVFKKIIFSLAIDGRKEKVEAFVNLAASIGSKNQLSYDQRELYVEILDNLNPFHLTILSHIVKHIMNSKIARREVIPTEVADSFESKGVAKAITFQGINVLVANGLLNQGSGGTIGDGSLKHFLTDMGEEFYEFIAGKE